MRPSMLRWIYLRGAAQTATSAATMRFVRPMNDCSSFPSVSALVGVGKADEVDEAVVEEVVLEEVVEVLEVVVEGWDEVLVVLLVVVVVVVVFELVVLVDALVLVDVFLEDEGGGVHGVHVLVGVCDLVEVVVFFVDVGLGLLELVVESSPPPSPPSVNSQLA